MSALAAVLALLLVGAAKQPVQLFVDPMDSAARWPASGSDSVKASAALVPAADGKAIELSYDYGRVSGYAFLRREVKLDLPDNFEVRFRMRGSSEVPARVLPAACTSAPFLTPSSGTR